MFTCSFVWVSGYYQFSLFLSVAACSFACMFVCFPSYTAATGINYSTHLHTLGNRGETSVFSFSFFFFFKSREKKPENVVNCRDRVFSGSRNVNTSIEKQLENARAMLPKKLLWRVTPMRRSGGRCGSVAHVHIE